MSIYLKNFLRFLLLIGIQVLLLNKISLRWWGSPISGAPPFTPFLYPLLILLLPVRTPVWIVMLAGFFTGLTIDAFMDTGGMHAAACVLMAYARKPLLSLLLPGQIDEYGEMTPSAKSMNWSPFLTYSIILLFLHHLFYFIIEIWSFGSLGYLLIKLFVTLITSMIFVVIYTLFFSTRSKQSR